MKMVGLPREHANSIALMMTAFVEAGIMLCLAQKSSELQREVPQKGNLKHMSMEIA
jgi:hypothetical protein